MSVSVTFKRVHSQDFTYTTLWELTNSCEDLADVLGGSGGGEESGDSDEGLHVDC